MNKSEEYTHLVAKGQAMVQLISAQSITCSEAWTAAEEVSIFRVCTTAYPPLASLKQELATILHSPIEVLLSVVGTRRPFSVKSKAHGLNEGLRKILAAAVRIKVRIIELSISVVGLNRSMPLAVVFGPA